MLIYRNTFADIPWRNTVAAGGAFFGQVSPTPKIYCLAVCTLWSHSPDILYEAQANSLSDITQPVCVTARVQSTQSVPAFKQVTVTLWERKVRESQAMTLPVGQRKPAFSGVCTVPYSSTAALTTQEGQKLQDLRLGVESPMEILDVWKGSTLDRLPDSITTSYSGRSSQATAALPSGGASKAALVFCANFRLSRALWARPFIFPENICVRKMRGHEGSLWTKSGCVLSTSVFLNIIGS